MFWLVGGFFATHLKHMLVQIGSFPQGSGWKTKKYLKPPNQISIILKLANRLGYLGWPTLFGHRKCEIFHSENFTKKTWKIVILGLNPKGTKSLNPKSDDSESVIWLNKKTFWSKCKTWNLWRQEGHRRYVVSRICWTATRINWAETKTLVTSCTKGILLPS